MRIKKKEERGFIMKSKMFSFRLLALHGIVLAGILLTQGCATGQCPACFLNWPYGVPVEEPMISSEPDYTIISTEPGFLPPDISFQPSYESATVPSGGQLYTVQKGDTLSAIASMYGTSWKNLAEYNGLTNPNKLFAGQEIRIPGDLGAAPVIRSSAPASSVETPRAPIGEGTSYVIQRGDTLSGIAKRAGVTVAELKAVNALDSNRIVAGKSLTIPKGGEVIISVPSGTAVEPVKIDAAVPELAPIAELAPLTPSAIAPVYDHVLYPGETIEDVARQYGSSKEEIMILNGITDPDSVKPGTKLLVPIPD